MASSEPFTIFAISDYDPVSDDPTVTSQVDRLFSDILAPSDADEDPYNETRNLWNRVSEKLKKGPTEKTGPKQWTPRSDVIERRNRVSEKLKKGPTEKTGPKQWTPRSDVIERKNGFEIAIEVPGVEQSDISVDVAGNLLTVRGESKRNNEKRDEEAVFHKLERSVGQFSRSFRLPGLSLARPQDINASFYNGVLTVYVPKKNDAPVSIRINTGSAPVARNLWNRVSEKLKKGTAAPKQWTPRSDVIERKNGFEIAIEVPGVEQSDINVDVAGNVLTVRGESKRNEKRDEETVFHKLERSVGEFSRSFCLPGLSLVRPQEINASFYNGVLTVYVPKKTTAPVSIRINTGSAPVANSPSAPGTSP
eukprot:CAMPEP_0184671960 /NCGR_PEP_ID=MMETSP0308-20130426/85806_1 /TAXON_ID=38269 /ORGANISM="Gloeochaete witrockiana, Strain SAG 46.84" /LENGTH=363 /DNA_ID=CAMNT_0027119191 /DNA_START=180 /DNA_END=1272 /DNA_ORIENTATION=-